ncbi:MAG: hypothetical protein AB7L13_13575 [Acidimicrobiia bacterium]
MDTEPDSSPGTADRWSAVDRWSADNRADDRIDERRRSHWRRQADAAEATIAGALLDCLEHGRPVTVQTTSGRRYTGTVTDLSDEAAVVDRGNDAVIVAVSAVTHLFPGAVALAANRQPGGTLTMYTALTRAAEEQARVSVSTGPGEPVIGQIESVSPNAVTIATGSTLVLVAVQAISDVVLTGSG